MVKATEWKDTAELIGIVAIVVSLLFVGLQLWQAERISRSEIRQSIFANQIEMNNAIIRFSDVWLRGNAGDDLTPPEAEIFRRQVMNLNQYYYEVVQWSRTMGLPYEDADLAAYAGFLYENRGALKVWRDHEKWIGKYRGLIDSSEKFTPGWIESVESKLEIFDQQEAN
jgi:hypothetical protein